MYPPFQSSPSQWGELAVNALNMDYTEAVTVVQFDGLHEVVWAGSDTGRVSTFLAPHLEPYACWPAHKGRVQGILPMPGTDCALTFGRDAATLSTNGGLRRAGIKAGLQPDGMQASFGGCCFEPSTKGRGTPQAAIMGLQSCGLLHWDLTTSKILVRNNECLADGVAHLCGPVGRGSSLLAAGLSSGRLVLLDCRTPRSLQLEPGAGSVGVVAHTAGFAAMDARGDFVACCGFTTRGSCMQPDAYLKVYDVRNLGGSTLKPMLTLPFPHISGAPTCLSFHPRMNSLLLVGCGRGGVNMVDIARGAAVSTHQVTFDGSSLGSVCVSPTGEAWLLGDATSCVRLWSESDTPNCHAVPTYLEAPSTLAVPSVEIGEEDSFASVPQFPLASMDPGASYLSDIDPSATMSVGMPPRIIDPTIQKAVRQVDFVGHHPNPKYVRGAPFGQATAAIAHHRNMRVPMVSIKPPPLVSTTKEKKRRTGPLLPPKFKRVEIRAQAGLKFEEFNFASYNGTRFAGLENDLPNSYANALLQVLYFTPALRTALLNHVPEPDSEFCLACELGLLFRCMAASNGKPCQASNLLRALRQVREAAALGLLDSPSISRLNPGAGGAPAREAGGADSRWALGRRVAALARFLMDHCHKEASPKTLPDGPLHNRSGITPQPVPSNAALRPLLERLAALPHTVRLKCLGGSKEEKTREDRAFQVDLHYPMEREKAARLAADATHLGFNKVPEAAAAVLRPASSMPAPLAASAGIAGAQGKVAAAEGGDTSQQQQQQQQAGQQGEQQQQQQEAQQGQGQGLAEAAGGTVPSPSTKPLFSDLLRYSMLAVGETRAWFSESRGYALVRQSRLPTALPQVLAVDCSVKNASEASWWLPAPTVTRSSGQGAGTEPQVGNGQEVQAQDVREAQLGAGQAPWALRIEVLAEQQDIHVTEAASVEQLYRGSSSSSGPCAVYALSAMICQIQDADEEDAGAASTSERLAAAAAVAARSAAAGSKVTGEMAAPEGHLVSLIRVPRRYWDEAPLRPCLTQLPLGAAPSVHPKPPTRTAAAHKSCCAAAALTPQPPAPAVGGGARDSGAAPLQGSVHTQCEGSEAAATAAAAVAAAAAAASKTRPEAGQQPSAPNGAEAKGTGPQGGHMAADAEEGEEWLLFNDFTISRVDRSEFRATYGAQKLPCLVYFTRVDPPPEDDGSSPPPLEPMQAATAPASAAATPAPGAAHVGRADSSTAAPAAPAAGTEGKDARPALQPYTLPPPPMPPVLTQQQFKQLCLSPPLQGPQPHNAFKFVPLDVSPNSKEAPRPGLLLALDAEFVMVQPPERLVKRSMEVLTRNSRLGLARVSILRGEGPRLGTPCIDDYVRAVEPVFDHLTRYSGLVPGDLDPTTTSHYLTTMKHAYLKLRYLVDCGCVFVGHGLHKDFRMINIYVPPEQLVDTVELFSFKRKRKLSLRFLASYLLGINIQANVHDSVEDARTALRLYLKYRQLVEEGTFQEKLEELYSWGKQYGWEPVVWGPDGKPVPPSAPVMISL